MLLFLPSHFACQLGIFPMGLDAQDNDDEILLM
jgi:hypothetical protein